MKTMNELWVDHLRDLGYNGKTLQDSLYRFLKSEVPNTSMLMSINDLWASYLEYQGFQGGISKLYEYLYSLGYTQVSLNDRIMASLIDGTMLKSKHRVKLDFEAGDYRENGFVTPLTDIVTFIRLSAATEFVDSSLLNYAAGVPRISNKGLLIEPQRTNTTKWSSDLMEDASGFGWKTQGGASISSIPQPYLPKYLIQDDGSKLGVYFASRQDDQGSGSISSIHLQSTSGTVTTNVLRERLKGNIKTITEDGGVYSLAFEAYPSGSPGIFYVSDLRSGSATEIIAAYPQVEIGVVGTSYIPTIATPVTRSPDSLVIPVASGETVSGDWDTDVSYTLSAGEAIFTATEAGRIRSIYVN